MFGEIPMYGNYEVSVDSKSRIIVPAKTKVEQGEKLLVLKEEEIIKVMAHDEFDRIIAEMEERYNKETDLNKKKKLEEAIFRLCSSVYSSSVVDKQGRILLNSELELTGKVKVIGCRSYLRLEKTR